MQIYIHISLKQFSMLTVKYCYANMISFLFFLIQLFPIFVFKILGMNIDVRALLHKQVMSS